MPMPREYRHATADFEAFLADAQDELGLATRNMTYTTVQAVLIVFRRRLAVDHAIKFASALPAVLRAIFVADWDLAEKRLPFLELAAMNLEVRQLRQHHNFSPDHAIEHVASVLRRHVDLDEFERALEQLPTEARGYWLAA